MGVVHATLKRAYVFIGYRRPEKAGHDPNDGINGIKTRYDTSNKRPRVGKFCDRNAFKTGSIKVVRYTSSEVIPIAELSQHPN